MREIHMEGGGRAKESLVATEEELNLGCLSVFGFYPTQPVYFVEGGVHTTLG